MPESNGGTPALPVAPDPPLESPAWFHYEIDLGLERLARLRLQGRPQTEVELRDTVDGLCEQLLRGSRWDQHFHTPLLRRAFHELGERQFWPTPHDILSCLKSLSTGALWAPTHPEQLALPASSDEPLGSFGDAIRQAIKMLPNHKRYEFLAGMAKAMFHWQPYMTTEQRAGTIQKHVRDLIVRLQAQG